MDVFKIPKILKLCLKILKLVHPFKILHCLKSKGLSNRVISCVEVLFKADSKLCYLLLC